MTLTAALSTAQLAIYAPFTFPLLYNLHRHGKHGLLGWLYLLIFITLRMAGSALSISSPTSSTALVISNIGLSPLLLGALGVLHEG
jgi:hypothetical protein